MKPNFQCNDCGFKFYVQQFTQIFKKDKDVFKDKYNAVIICPSCQPSTHKKSDISFIGQKKGVPELMGAMGGTFVPQKTLLLDKQKKLKERSTHHFVNEVLPKHKDKDMIPYFKRKHKDLKFKDHEKMK